MQVGVVGASGYGGGELLRLLAGHPEFEVTVVAGNRAADRAVDEVFPQLSGSSVASMTIVPALTETLAGTAVMFLATPADVSAGLAPALVGGGTTVVDLSGAFRLEATTYARWYRAEHAAPELTPAPYGLPELFRSQLAGARLVAGPGCYATAALLCLWPLTGLIDPATVTVVGMSGVSGAGRGLREDLHAGHAMGNVAAYGAPGHRHTPEMESSWQRAAETRGETITPSLTFVPHLVPMVRGLVATITATLLPEVTGDAVLGAVTDAYAAEPFVSVMPSWPQAAHVLGGNGAHVHAAVDESNRRVIASCAVDNLVKGAAGQAIQAANAAVGMDEDAGLSPIGVYP